MNERRDEALAARAAAHGVPTTDLPALAMIASRVVSAIARAEEGQRLDHQDLEDLRTAHEDLIDNARMSAPGATGPTRHLRSSGLIVAVARDTSSSRPLADTLSIFADDLARLIAGEKPLSGTELRTYFEELAEKASKQSQRRSERIVRAW